VRTPESQISRKQTVKPRQGSEEKDQICNIWLVLCHSSLLRKGYDWGGKEIIKLNASSHIRPKAIWPLDDPPLSVGGSQTVD
jgi:hypothetical protein